MAQDKNVHPCQNWNLKLLIYHADTTTYRGQLIYKPACYLLHLLITERKKTTLKCFNVYM